jgi:hypothetical protein
LGIEFLHRAGWQLTSIGKFSNTLLAVFRDGHFAVRQARAERVAEVAGQLLLRNGFAVQVVGLPIVFRIRQHASVRFGQFAASRVSALFVTSAVRDFALVFVCLDVFNVGFDVDTVAADAPVQSTASNVHFRLPVALNNW